MPDRAKTSWRKTRVDAVAKAAALALVLVAGGVSAEEFKLGEDPFSAMLKWRPTAPDKDMPAFVKKTRPPENALNFTPLTGQEPARPKPMTPEELDRQMKRFDAAAAANRARAARAFGAAAPAARSPAKRAKAD